MKTWNKGGDKVNNTMENEGGRQMACDYVINALARVYYRALVNTRLCYIPGLPSYISRAISNY